MNVTLTIVLALNGSSSLSMPTAAIATAIVRAVAFNLAMPQHARIRVSLADWRAITVFGLRMITIRGAAILAQRGSEMVLGRFLGLATLGIYTRASILSQQIFFNIYGTATQVVFTELSRVYRETGVVRDTFLRGLEIILAFMWPMLFGLAVLSRPAIHILYGPNWTAAALPLSLMMIAQAISLSFGMNWELFVLRNETAKQTKYELFRMALGLVFFCVGAMFSLTWAVIGRLCDVATGAIIYLPKMAALSGARGSEIVAIYVRSAMLSAAAVVPSFLVMVANDWSETTSPLEIAGGVALGVGFWLVALRLMRHRLFDEIARVVVRIAPARLARLARLGRWAPLSRGS